MGGPRPFEIAVADDVLDRIASRVAQSRIGYAPEGGEGWAMGTSAAYLAEFIAYWRDRYDWRAAEVELNRWPQFTVEIDGIDIHFQHVRGSGAGRIPVILTHGWPGSFVEFQGVIERLAFPEHFGGRAEDGLDLVIPSLPGFAFSGRPRSPLGARRVAAMWRTLMTEILGYSRFGAQGGDWGSSVTVRLGAEHGDVVDGIHLNFIMGPPPGPADGEDTADYRRKLKRVLAEEGAYMYEHRTKPQTVGLALHDHPVGIAAWMLEKFCGWGDTGGDIERRFSEDHLITNLMTYLVNDAFISSIWAYPGIAADGPFTGRVDVPVGVAHFPAEFYPWPSRRDAERSYAVHRWSEMPSGGHFAAMEEPQLFADDVLAFFSSLK
ncbi:epoxide hydrolase 1 [Sphingomonas sp. MG17]|uniref:Epoxide hydrolase 1 n=1 Tax=Sphingomonas tagetis TaxID=2949092 RepID=A0A9X2KQ06_9SPHN|nr:epoxide hydrolase [Sphingomonas tagetis]MCP3731233.1 epoxide hydrolase 1 [Sphingomonas tagetis]